MPLMPNALKEFNLQDYDLIISSESGPAKGVTPNPDAYHICYCHSPMRYLWDMYHDYFRKAGFATRFFMKRFIPSLRLWDVISANLVDRFIANSTYVAKRVRRYYNREAEIIFPPVAIEKYLITKRKPEDFYLFFGQLVGYKRADIALDACVSSGRKLVVAGSGATRKNVGRYKKSEMIAFTGRVSDEEAAQLFAHARALVFPGIEDFGIIPVEAMAAGCPVIAYRKGGVLDTVKEDVTGVFFDEQTPDSLIGALEKFEAIEGRFADREVFKAHVRQFSREAFIERVARIIMERKRV
jgi:glycosyltransferase involved in cell wall biosynthesis